jgi:hypothetical protein
VPQTHFSMSVHRIGNESKRAAEWLDPGFRRALGGWSEHYRRLIRSGLKLPGSGTNSQLGRYSAAKMALI